MKNGSPWKAVPVAFSSSHSVLSSSSLCYVPSLKGEIRAERRRLRGRNNTLGNVLALSIHHTISPLLTSESLLNMEIRDWKWRTMEIHQRKWDDTSSHLALSFTPPIHSRQKRAEIRCLDLLIPLPSPLLFSSNSTSFKTKVLTTRDKDSLRNPRRIFSLFWPLINRMATLPSFLLPSLRLGTNFTPKRRYVGWLSVRFFATTTPDPSGLIPHSILYYSFYPPPISFPLTG